MRALYRLTMVDTWGGQPVRHDYGLFKYRREAEIVMEREQEAAREIFTDKGASQTFTITAE